VTNGDGLYRVDAVDLGNYSVKITASGFGTVAKTNISVQAIRLLRSMCS
jgi:hypothetical protein